MNVSQDMFAELATAVYAGDLDAATATLDLMRASGGEGLAATLMRARQVSHPFPRAADMAVPIPLPQPGKHPLAVFGGSGNHPDEPKRKRRKASA